MTYWEATRDLKISLMLILPLLALYEIGLLFTFEALNGVDFMTLFILSWFGVNGLIVFDLILFGGAIYAISKLKREDHFTVKQGISFLIETGIYAAFLGTVILTIMRYIPVPTLTDSIAELSTGSKIILSIGAGVHEELFFRLLWFGGTMALLERWLEWKPFKAGAVALLLSSVAFSAAHHVGDTGDPFLLGTFLFRFLAGCIFCLLYRFRGLAPAVYTHALYDIMVLVGRDS